MTYYIFDIEENEYIEVERRFPVINGKPLSPVEVYKRKMAQKKTSVTNTTKEEPDNDGYRKTD